MELLWLTKISKGVNMKEKIVTFLHDKKNVAIVILVLALICSSCLSFYYSRPITTTESVRWVVVDLDGNGALDIIVSGEVIMNPPSAPLAVEPNR